MYHPESDSLFEVDSSELPEKMKSIDGQLCNNVTGDPQFEARFKREFSCKSAIAAPMPSRPRAKQPERGRTRGTSQSAAR